MSVEHSSTTATLGGGAGALAGAGLVYWDIRRGKVARRHRTLYLGGATLAGAVVGSVLGWLGSAKPT